MKGIFLHSEQWFESLTLTGQFFQEIFMRLSDIKLAVVGLGYSPERINPGDKTHRLSTIKKVTAGSTEHVADLVDALYNEIVTAGTHRAGSIKVAEAAKVIENTQPDSRPCRNIGLCWMWR